MKKSIIYDVFGLHYVKFQQVLGKIQHNKSKL